LTDNGILVPILLIAFVVGGVLGFIVKKRFSRKKLESCENLSARIIDEAKKEAETIKKEAILQAKENLLKVKAEFEKDTRERKNELDGLERRIRSKEENLERRIDLLSQRETSCENREKAILHKESQLNEKHERADRMLEEQKVKLEQIAGISSEEAKKLLVCEMESAAKQDAALTIRKIEEDARRTADNKAREVISYAIQRYAGDYVAENTVSVVNLPND